MWRCLQSDPAHPGGEKMEGALARVAEELILENATGVYNHGLTLMNTDRNEIRLPHPPGEPPACESLPIRVDQCPSVVEILVSV